MKPRSLLPVVGWCAATAAGVAIASFALEPVLRTAVPDAVAPVSDNENAVATAPQPAPALTDQTPVHSAGSPSVSGSHRAGPTATHRPSPTVESSVSYQDGWTVVTDASGNKSYFRTYTTNGGTASFRLVPGTVYLVAATPAAGFQVDTTQSQPDDLAVVFHTANHSFTVNVLWYLNAPYAQVTEVGS